jgi:hypothetical protein
MENRIDLFGLLKQEGKLTKILVYPAITKEIDPISHEKEKVFLNPITIDAYVRDVSPEALVWRYYGVIPIGSKEFICEKRWEETIKSASRITINDEEYKTLWNDSKGFSILERENYLVIVVAKKDL